MLKKTETVITEKPTVVKNEFNRSNPNPEWDIKAREKKENRIPIDKEILDPFNLKGDGKERKGKKEDADNEDS